MKDGSINKVQVMLYGLLMENYI